MVLFTLIREIIWRKNKQWSNLNQAIWQGGVILTRWSCSSNLPPNIRPRRRLPSRRSENFIGLILKIYDPKEIYWQDENFKYYEPEKDLPYLWFDLKEKQSFLVFQDELSLVLEWEMKMSKTETKKQRLMILDGHNSFIKNYIITPEISSTLGKPIRRNNWLSKKSPKGS